ncbi:MAG: 3-oxoacyl-[acyl-carrier protein] reductase, partial [uncultured Blastococcus sp.]
GAGRATGRPRRPVRRLQVGLRHRRRQRYRCRSGEHADRSWLAGRGPGPAGVGRRALGRRRRHRRRWPPRCRPARRPGPGATGPAGDGRRRVRSGGVRGHHTRRVPADARHPSRRHGQCLPRGAAGDAGAPIGLHRRHHLGAGAGGLGALRPLRRRQGRHPRPGPQSCRGGRRRRCAGQQRGARADSNADARPSPGVPGPGLCGLVAAAPPGQPPGGRRDRPVPRHRGHVLHRPDPVPQRRSGDL